MIGERLVSAERRVRAAVVVLVLLTGCESTVAPAPAGTGRQEPPSVVALSPAPVADDPAPVADDPGPAAAGPGTGAPPAAPPADPRSPPPVPAVPEQTSSPAPPAPARPLPTCAAPAHPQAPGITDDEIAVGAQRFRNLAALGVDPPERELHEYVEAMVDHVNATGGIACRRVRIVWYDTDLADPATFSTASGQAQCARWTEDDPVFAAFPAGFNNMRPGVYTCMDRAGAVTVDARGHALTDAEELAAWPRLVFVNAARMDRTAEAQVHALVRQGFLTPSSRIGVVHYDAPAHNRTVDQVLLPALAGYGLRLTERRWVALGPGLENAERDRDIANAALRFKLADVDRVLFVRGSLLAAQFMRAAERNRYRPRYGLTSDDLWTDVPLEQLAGARGIGWLAEQDLRPRAPDTWAARDACLAVFNDRGLPTGTYDERAVALLACEALSFFRAAVEAAPAPLSADGVMAGVAALGGGYESPVVRWTRFGLDRRDGVAAYHDVAYDRDCGCFVYTGGPHPLP